LIVLPDPEIIPALAAHVTFVFVEPVTEAVNVWDPPAVMLVAFGEIVTETPLAFWLGAEDDFPPPPQAVNREMANPAMAITKPHRAKFNRKQSRVFIRKDEF
jgi:hypothetical protein